jgi:Replication initiator protein, pSAM2
VANYIAKYATKTLTAPGLPSCRIRSDVDIERLRCPAHYRRLITTAWQLGTRYRAWAHMLGYGGHFLTKSRRYSVTFGQLRAARTDHRRALRPPDADRDAWGRPLDETVVLVLPVIWTYEGIGRPLTADAELALAAAARAREHYCQMPSAVRHGAVLSVSAARTFRVVA